MIQVGFFCFVVEWRAIDPWPWPARVCGASDTPAWSAFHLPVILLKSSLSVFNLPGHPIEVAYPLCGSGTELVNQENDAGQDHERGPLQPFFDIFLSPHLPHEIVYLFRRLRRVASLALQPITS